MGRLFAYHKSLTLSVLCCRLPSNNQTRTIMADTLKIVAGRVSPDYLRSQARFKQVHRKLTDSLSRKFGQGDVNVSLAPKNVAKAKVISMRKFSSSKAMEPYIEYLEDLGVKCSTKDPNNRCFDISLTVTFDFILKHLGEAEYKEAVRISKGRPGNEDLGIEPIEGGATFVHSSNGASPNGNGHKEPVATSPEREEESDDVRASAPTPSPATASKKWDRETLKPVLKDLVKKHKLKSKGLTGRAPEDSIGSVVVSVGNLDRAEQVFTEAGFHYYHKVSKKNRNIAIFRFYSEPVEGVTQAQAKTATEVIVAQYLAENASAETKASKEALSDTTPPSQDPADVRLLMRKLVKLNELAVPNANPGRVKGDVVTHVLIRQDAVELAKKVFGDAGLVFKYAPSKRYKGAMLFQFFNGLVTKAAVPPVPTPVTPPSLEEELAAPPTPSATAAEQFRANAPVERQEVAEMGSVVAMTSIANSLERMAETLDKGFKRESAEQVSRKIVQALAKRGTRLFSGATDANTDGFCVKELSSMQLEELLVEVLGDILVR